jgi:RNA polymerase sigma factor (TIGR02999 family)
MAGDRLAKAASSLVPIVESVDQLHLALSRTTIVEMSDVTRILSQIESGDPSAAAQLLPLVYEELRKLAAAKLAQEKPGQTLQATALVHDAYLRLVGDGKREQAWDSRGHFFAAAAEGMRRILVETARRKGREKHGGEFGRKDLVLNAISLPVPSEELLAIHEALVKLEATNPQAAHLVKMRYFAGFTIPETAEHMGISPRKANQIWSYARAWLATEVADGSSS